MRLLALAACAVLLAGCISTGGTLRPADAELETRWQNHAQRLAQIQGFSLRGRASDGRGIQADVHWQQLSDGAFALRLTGPFGVGAVMIRGDARGAVEIQTRDERIATADPEGWMRARLGWAFPVRGLRYWILGQPAPDLPSQHRLDDQGRLLTLQQAGWSLAYPEYIDAAGLVLPRRLDATQDDRRLKLVIDRWDEWTGA